MLTQKRNKVKYCIDCGNELIIGDNWTEYDEKACRYRCQPCSRPIIAQYVRGRSIGKTKTLYCSTDNFVTIQTQLKILKDGSFSILTGFSKARGLGTTHTNKQCSSYLGVHIAEQVLSKVFKNVESTSYHNSGYDFICGGGYKIDVKSSTLSNSKYPYWRFSIKYNIIADYFLCLAFDNRDDLNPLHIWLIPGVDINDHSGITVTPNTFSKFDKYKLDKLNKIKLCCNELKGDNL